MSKNSQFKIEIVEMNKYKNAHLFLFQCICTLRKTIRKKIYRYYQAVLQHHWMNQLRPPLQLLRLVVVVEQQLIEHNMLDNTKQLHQEVHFVVEN